ncbi:PAS domain-containing protein [Polyangium sorediatum]|uniref:PAS domain-containing protein n=1 Tax=Polyangium sorediatum TaxID=889274 RepID=A0ABT6NVT4_9BACT|nr:PAS domain-containing protein [Polyangium sorediatum]MDI1432406.1 PAS domain-containing protein [Polyangium sorediatum]
MNDGRLSDAALSVFPEPIAIVDRALRVQKANTAWTTTFVDSPLTETSLAAALAKVLSGETTRAEVTLETRSAEHTVTIVPVPDGDTRAALVHARPVPVREPAPRSRDERLPATLLRRVLDRLPVTVSLIDAEGRSVFSNDTRARLLGAAATEERESGTRALLIDPADADFVREVEARVLATGTEEIITSDVPTALGTRSMFFHLVPVEGEGEGERLVLCVGQDVTEQLRAERDLREQQDFIRQVIDCDPNLIFVKDDCGTFLLANKAFADIFGKTAEEIVGQHERALNEHARADGFLSIDQQVFATLEERTVEEEILWHTGELRWYQTTKRPLVRPSGEVHVLGCSVDITTRLETHRKLEEAATEVERRAVEAFRQAEAKAALVEELDQKLGIIETQHQEILTLSAPLLEVAEGVLAVPIVGAMTQTRAEEIMHRLLAAIVERQVANVVLDLTGLETIEMHTADHLMSIVRAIRLLGADAAISGIRPAVAQTIVELGIDLSGFVTKRTLRSAIFSREVARSAALARRR